MVDSAVADSLEHQRLLQRYRGCEQGRHNNAAFLNTTNQLVQHAKSLNWRAIEPRVHDRMLMKIEHTHNEVTIYLG
jgi:hypothetical protein